MQAERLAQHWRQRPFRSIRVCLEDGTAYIIRRPEMMMVGRPSVYIGLSKWPDATHFDTAVEVGLSQIVRAEPVDRFWE